MIGDTDLLDEHPDEGTVDEVHPTDLGFISIADYLTPHLKRFIAV